MPTYLDLEQSRFGGKPVELYHFYQDAEDWFYTSAPFPVIPTDGFVYTPIAIHRGDYEGGGDDAPGQMPISFPVATNLGTHIQAGTIVSPIAVKVYRFHRTAESDVKLIIWGEIISKDISDEILTVQIQPVRAQLDLIIPRGLAYRNQCVWNTYDPATCKVDKAAFTFTGTVSDITGLIVTVPGAGAFSAIPTGDNTFYIGGIMQAENLRLGLIESADQLTDTYTLDEMIPGLEVGMEVTLTAGDDRMAETCRDRFGNILRYMAFRKMPLDNPFTGQGLRRGQFVST